MNGGRRASKDGTSPIGSEDMVKRTVTAILLVGAVLASGVAIAKTIYLNGVDISGVRNQRFERCTVFIDGEGDVHISCEGYKVEVVDAEDEEPSSTSPGEGANAALRTRYFLVTRPSGGRAQYDLVVAVNGVERKVVRAGSSAQIVEVSSWFRKGRNTVDVTATKRLEGGRKSISRNDTLELIVGSGHEEGSVVKIDVVNISFKCDASQLSDVKKTYTINAI